MEHKDVKHNRIPPRPKARYYTSKAVDEVQAELSLPNGPWMQDWPYEVIAWNDVEKYITHYENTSDEDKKFLLMEAILYAVEMNDEEAVKRHWQRIEPLLRSNFSLHEFTIYEGSSFDLGELDSEALAREPLIPLLRELWWDERG
jgi:hypothetical protein